MHFNQLHVGCREIYASQLLFQLLCHNEKLENHKEKWFKHTQKNNCLLANLDVIWLKKRIGLVICTAVIWRFKGWVIVRPLWRHLSFPSIKFSDTNDSSFLDWWLLISGVKLKWHSRGRKVSPCVGGRFRIKTVERVSAKTTKQRPSSSAPSQVEPMNLICGVLLQTEETCLSSATVSSLEVLNLYPCSIKEWSEPVSSANTVL